MTTLQKIARVLRDPETNAYADELRRLREERDGQARRARARAREYEAQMAAEIDSEATREEWAAL